MPNFANASQCHINLVSQFHFTDNKILAPYFYDYLIMNSCALHLFQFYVTMQMVQTVGIDLGSQKCMLVADDADIVLTDTGSISRPTLVSFFGKSRLVGEEAAPQVRCAEANV